MLYTVLVLVLSDLVFSEAINQCQLLDLKDNCPKIDYINWSRLG